MLAVALALVASTPQQTETLTLAIDTYIDKQSPNGNAGREPLLVGGTDKAVLIRFPELGLSVGAGKRVVSAQLTLVMARPGDPKLSSLGRVMKPWGEGGWRLDQFADPKVKALAAATWNDALAGKDGLSWDRAGASGRTDVESLAVGRTETKDDRFTLYGLESAVQQMVDDPQNNFGLRLEFGNATTLFSADSLGYGPELTVHLADGPPQPAPDLRVVACEPESTDPVAGQPVTWRVTVRNHGDLDSRSQSLMVSYVGRSVVSRSFNQTIAIGATQSFTFALPHRNPVEQPTMQPLIVRVMPAESDRNPSDNGTTVYTGSLKVAVTGAAWEVALATAIDLNERVFPLSKFGAWPSGCLERIHLVSRAEDADLVAYATGDGDVYSAILRAVTGLPSALLRPFASEPPRLNGSQTVGYVADAGQIGLFPDTRDDVIVPQGLAIPDRTSTALIFGDLAMNEHKMLSRSETTIINSMLGKRGAARELPWHMTPSSIFFRILTPDGLPASGSRLDLYQLVGGAFGSQPVFTVQIGQDGSALMTPRPGGAFGRSNPYGDLQRDGSNGWLLAVVTANETSHSTWIPVWQLWEEYARGNTAAAFIELRVQVASGTLIRGENMALNRLVTDMKGRFPAELNALVDGKNETSVAFGKEPEGYWIEIDLGRDRPIGEISLVFDGPVWTQFRIVTYKTAQSPDEGVVWSEEANGPANPTLKTTDDGKTVLTYLSKSVRSRFVRVVPFSGESVRLAEIQIVPIGPG